MKPRKFSSDASSISTRKKKSEDGPFETENNAIAKLRRKMDGLIKQLY